MSTNRTTHQNKRPARGVTGLSLEPRGHRGAVLSVLKGKKALCVAQGLDHAPNRVPCGSPAPRRRVASSASVADPGGPLDTLAQLLQPTPR